MGFLKEQVVEVRGEYDKLKVVVFVMAIIEEKGEMCFKVVLIDVGINLIEL